jgi:hypothetical protein
MIWPKLWGSFGHTLLFSKHPVIFSIPVGNKHYIFFITASYESRHTHTPNSNAGWNRKPTISVAGYVRYPAGAVRAKAILYLDDSVVSQDGFGFHGTPLRGNNPVLGVFWG